MAVIAAFKFDDSFSACIATGQPKSAHGGLGPRAHHSQAFHTGLSWRTRTASSVSISVGAPNPEPFCAALVTLSMTAGWAWPVIIGPQEPI